MSCQHLISANFAHRHPKSLVGSRAVIRSLSAAYGPLPGSYPFGEPSPQSVDENLKPVLEALIGRAERPGGRAQQRKGADAGWRISGTGSGTGRIGVAGGGGGAAGFGLGV